MKRAKFNHFCSISGNRILKKQVFEGDFGFFGGLFSPINADYLGKIKVLGQSNAQAALKKVKKLSKSCKKV